MWGSDAGVWCGRCHGWASPSCRVDEGGPYACRTLTKCAHGFDACSDSNTTLHIQYTHSLHHRLTKTNNKSAKQVVMPRLWTRSTMVGNCTLMHDACSITHHHPVHVVTDNIVFGDRHYKCAPGPLTKRRIYKHDSGSKVIEVVFAIMCLYILCLLS